MTRLVLLCCLGLPGGDPTPDDLAAYQTEATKVGRDADAHVRLALWCESHGLDAERVKHLAMAVLIEPDHPTARGLLGQAADGEEWLKPKAIAERLEADAELAKTRAEYEQRRARADRNADDQWRLAVWCEQNGLESEAYAHFSAVTQIDPRREAAWKRLGCKKHNGRWLNPEQIAAEKAEAQAQDDGNRKWLPLLIQWREWLADEDCIEDAEALLATVDDPRAVPSVWQVFAMSGDPANQAIAVQLLGQIQSPPASRALALISVLSEAPNTRQAALEVLSHRDPCEFVGLLISLLQSPIQYEVRPVGGPGSPGVLFVQGERFNVQRLYTPPPMPEIGLQAGDVLGRDASGMLVLRRSVGVLSDEILTDQLLERRRNLEAQIQAGSGSDLGDRVTQALPGPEGERAGQVLAVVERTLLRREATQIDALTTAAAGSPRLPRAFLREQEVFAEIPVGQLFANAQNEALAAQRQLEQDVAAIEQLNAEVQPRNDRTLVVLEAVTGQDFGTDRKVWERWWIDQQGYRTRPEPERPTFVENVPVATSSPVAISLVSGATRLSSRSCFAAGTPVLASDGAKPIEELKVGDRVVTQDTATGALALTPILNIYHNPPDATLQVEFQNGETIVATNIHRFWKAGHGWVMAHDLKPGDRVRNLGGTTTVAAIEEGATQPVFNLRVAEGSSFFVGDTAILVHDNSLVEPTLSAFDTYPEPIAAR